MTRVVEQEFSGKEEVFTSIFGTKAFAHTFVRGTNVVYKGFPYHPDTSPSALPRWSFNQANPTLQLSKYCKSCLSDVYLLG
jgi:hypothetical protein